MFAPMGLTCCPPHGLTTVMLRFVSPMGHTLRPLHGGDSQQNVPYPTSTHGPWQWINKGIERHSLYGVAYSVR